MPLHSCLKRGPLEDISPANKRTTAVNGAWISPTGVDDEEEPCRHPTSMPHRFHSRSYTPNEEQKRLVRSLVDYRWRQKVGIDLDKALFKVLDDENMRDRSAKKRKERQVDVELLGLVIIGLLKFLYSPRHQRTLAEALVMCVFNVLRRNFPSEYQTIVLKESAMLLRREKMKAYKFQRTIDEQPTGGLNYGSIESIRKGVEEIPKYEMGVIPSSTTIKSAGK
jgi:hypothetical protein